MKPASAKNKGRLLQQWARETILSIFVELEPDDVKSTSMGAGGEDIQLSPAARKLIPLQIECKSKARVAIYKDYQQAISHGKGHEPVVIIKQNGAKPLAIVSVDFLFNLIRNKNEKVT